MNSFQDLIKGFVCVDCMRISGRNFKGRF